jgi:hypothetical protein
MAVVSGQGASSQWSVVVVGGRGAAPACALEWELAEQHQWLEVSLR